MGDPAPLKTCSMIIIGATGDGKSSLCNFILGKNKFTVSEDPNSETKETIGYYGDDEETKNIYVIDTPGLHDDTGTDKVHIQQMVSFLKQTKIIQSIIIVFNFMQDRMDGCIRTMLRIFADIFQVEDFWNHVAIVFTHYIEPKKQSTKRMMEEKKRVKIKRFPEEINKIIIESGSTPPHKIPCYFVDNDLEEIDPKSKEEINALIGWTSSLSPLNVEKVIAVDDKIQRQEDEFTEEIESSNKTGNIKKIVYKLKKRKKLYHRNGEITYTDWEEYDKKTDEKICPREKIYSYPKRYEETEKPVETEKGIEILTKTYQKTINVYDDGYESSTDEHEIEKERKKQTIEKIKKVKEVKTETRNMDENGNNVVQAKTYIIYEDGTTQITDDWHNIYIHPNPNNINSKGKFIRVETEQKKEIEKKPEIKEIDKKVFKGFLLIVPIWRTEKYNELKEVEYEVTYERTLTIYENFIDYGEWRAIKVEKKK